MCGAVREKFSENSDCVLDLAEVENFQEMRDIRHVLFTLAEVGNSQGLELQGQHISGGWYEHRESDIIGQPQKRTKGSQIAVRPCQRAEMKAHRIVEPRG